MNINNNKILIIIKIMLSNFKCLKFFNKTPNIIIINLKQKI